MHDQDYRYPDRVDLLYPYIAGQISKSFSMLVSHHINKTSFDPISRNESRLSGAH